jgi:pimeloyl-ACP methyl ester carboxylesterase
MPTTTSVLSDLYRELRGSGPPVLFIAGASGDAGHFAGAAARLADEFTAVAYDRRGCSRSAGLQDGETMSIAAQADDAAAHIEELGLAPTIVFGTSGGGNIALELVARRPELVRGAIVHEPGSGAVRGAARTGSRGDLGPPRRVPRPAQSLRRGAAADPEGARLMARASRQRRPHVLRGRQPWP